MPKPPIDQPSGSAQPTAPPSDDDSTVEPRSQEIAPAAQKPRPDSYNQLPGSAQIEQNTTRFEPAAGGE